MSHIINDCPVNKFEGGPPAVHTASDSAREWLCRVHCIHENIEELSCIRVVLYLAFCSKSVYTNVYHYLHRRLASREGIVSFGFMQCVCACVCLPSHDCTPP